jgi:hypothetical protein
MNTSTSGQASIAALAGILLSSTALSLALPVTFQVNMGPQILRGAFHPETDTVLVAGDAINGWSTSASPLTNSVANTNVWLETFEVSGTQGATVQYKFIYNSAEKGIVWEGNVGTGGAQNRSFQLANSAQVLPVVFFNNVTNSGVVTTPVIFQVDMSVQISQGNFDPATGTVFVAGDALNNWSTTASQLSQSASATNVWSGTFPITEAPGSTIAYKFVMNSSTWESRANRTFVLSNATETLPVVYFNDVKGLPASIPLTFQVDMSVQTAQGNFDPTTDRVITAGSFNNWSTTDLQLTNSPSKPNLYTGAVVDSGDGVGATIQYQFVINGSTWESIANRTYILSSTNQQIVPLSYFNDIPNLGSLSLDSHTGNLATLSWSAGPKIRLQSTLGLAPGAWQDVPNTTGQSNAVITLGGAHTFYRLTGP